MTKPILKAYYNKIFFEFLVHKDDFVDAIIILPGFPSSNNEDELMQFFYENGFNVFYLRYGGSFQSKGYFLESNPSDDITQCIKYINRGKIVSLWDMEEKSFKNRDLIFLTGSFGGAIACSIVAKSNHLISRIILSAPVWDFDKHNTTYEEQNLSHLSDFVKRAYQNLYRIKFNNLINQLHKFKELSPEYYLQKLNCPLLVFYDQEDKTVSIEHTREIIKKIKKGRLIEHN
ncbi:alpha/beta hydrolase [Candidatus Woesearchaeota archaeon]|nr:alpha/beta hydrolase [Candidatus Woesearchaeota archaeon]